MFHRPGLSPYTWDFEMLKSKNCSQSYTVSCIRKRDVCAQVPSRTLKTSLPSPATHVVLPWPHWSCSRSFLVHCFWASNMPHTAQRKDRCPSVIHRLGTHGLLICGGGTRRVGATETLNPITAQLQLGLECFLRAGRPDAALRILKIGKNRPPSFFGRVPLMPL